MESEQAYYYERAEAELRLAQESTDPAVVKAHYQLAGYYLDRVYGEGLEPMEERLAGPDRILDEGVREAADRLAEQLRSLGVIIVGPSADRNGDGDDVRRLKSPFTTP